MRGEALNDDRTPRRGLSVGHYQVLVVLLLVALGYILVTRHVVQSFYIILLCCAVPSVILHEVSHGVVALVFGDDTAKRAGRLTLNPLPHIDPFGTLILPALLALTGLPTLAYARPVPVNVSRLRHPRNESLLVALSGPVTNGILAGIALLLLRVAPLGQQALQPGLLLRIVYEFGFVNVLLGAFNLVPIPPLDGSAVLERFLPESLWPSYLRFRQYAFLVLFAAFFLVPGIFNSAIDPVLAFWNRLAFG